MNNIRYNLSDIYTTKLNCYKTPAISHIRKTEKYASTSREQQFAISIHHTSVPGMQCPIMLQTSADSINLNARWHILLNCNTVESH